MAIQPRTGPAVVPGAVNLTADTLDLADIIGVATTSTRSAQATLAVLAAFWGAPLNVRWFGAVGDGITDDTAALQRALDAASGLELSFPAGGIYKVTAPLLIKGHKTRIVGNNSTINFSGTSGQAALGFSLVSGTTYPQNCQVSQLIINVASASGIGFLVRSSYSAFTDISITLRSGSSGGSGFALPGDEAQGTGPYYNLFNGCSVQGQGTNQTGVLFSKTAPLERAGNANTWVGGRIGQCAIGADISGGGNNFYSPTFEGCTTSVKFNGCVECNVYGAYMEIATTGFLFTADAARNGVWGVYRTGVATLFSDAGDFNFWITGEEASSFPLGVAFPNPAALDSGATITSNTIAGYSEGTWTPTLVGGSTPGSYDVAVGDSAKFVRTGRLVTVFASMAITVNSAGTGELTFGGLPYQKADGMRIAGPLSTNNVTLASTIKSLVVREQSSSVGRNFLVCGIRDSTAPLFLTTADVSTGSRLDITFTYLAP